MVNPEKEHVLRTSLVLSGLRQKFFFHNSNKNHRKPLQIFGLIALYLLGLYILGTFFQWGNISLEFHDWKDITAPRLTFQKDALNLGVLPLHISDKSTVGGVTDRYLSIPDVILSPQIFLLKFMDIGTFSVVNILLLYSIGYLGLIRLKKRFQLSPFIFTLLFLLFNFNGHILAHLSIGHLTWVGYFLFPWFIDLIFAFLDGDKNWSWVAKMAFFLVFMFIQGSYHQFVWALFFLGFLYIIQPYKNWPALSAMVFGVLMSMFHIWPCTLSADSFESNFHGGYTGPVNLLLSLSKIQLPDTYFDSPILQKSLGWWELSLYIGIVGTLFLFGFGIAGWWKNRNNLKNVRALILPITGVSFLSFSVIYNFIRIIPFPLLTGERVSSRMMILPVLFLLTIAAINFQQWINQHKPLPIWITCLILALLAMLCIELWQNYQIWNVASVAQVFSHETFTPTDWFVSNHYDDWLYFLTLRRGAAVSIFSMILLGAFIWNENRENKSKSRFHK